MKDLDKIKELVATCDSKNIELAIVIGVNMEEYRRWILHTVIYNELYSHIKEWLLFKCYNENHHELDDLVVYGVGLRYEDDPFGDKRKTPSSRKTDQFVEECIDAYLSL